MKTNFKNFPKLLILLLVLFSLTNSKAQNSCSNAQIITAATYTVTGFDGTQIATGCTQGTSTEWYSYTPTVNKRVTVTSDLPQNICKDTYFNIYTGNCNQLTCFDVDDDSGTITCLANNFNYLSKITFDATAGTTYYIAWSNRWENTGFDFQLIEQPFVVTPCNTATLITAGTTTVSTINDPNVISNCTIASLAKWYKYIPSQNYRVTLSSDLPVNICKNTNFAVYSGNCNTALVCAAADDNSGIISCNIGNIDSFLSKRTFSVIGGNTYYIVWDNKWSTDGFEFELTENAFPCQIATPIVAGTTTISAIDGTNVPSTCTTGTAAKWFSYTPSTDLNLTITSDLPINICKNTNLIVYKGTCPSAITCFQTDDNSGVLECDLGNTTSLLSKKTFLVTAGETYYISWDNKWSADGFDFQLIESPIVFPVRYNTQILATLNSSFNNCVVDMNNDHKDDLVGINTNNIKIHEQNADGTFAINTFPNSGTYLPNWSIAAGDLNKDGFNDLIIGNGNGADFLTTNITRTTYTANRPGQYIFCQRTNFIDINNDGNLDAFSCHDIAPNVYYINDGLGNLSYNQSGVTPGAYSLGVLSTGGNYASLWTDYDNDGDQDMFISKCSGPPSELHRNDGNGVFTDISAIAAINVTPMQSWSSAIDDFDNDGDMDIMIGTNGTAANRFFKNNLDKTNNTEEPFTEITAGSGFDVYTSANRDYVSYDFDNDGKVDILGSGNKIMFNQGNNVFVPTFYPEMSVGAIGDLNNDGFLDIQIDNKIKYAIPNGNNWLKIAYKGIQSNSNGIGSRIEIYGAWGKQIRDVRSGEGFEFMSSLNTHFGIGTATAIDKIIIRWPSGKIDEILNPAINQTLVIAEGSSPSLASKNFELSNFKISPNPVVDVLQFSFNADANDIKLAEIVDVTGKLIAKQQTLNSNFIDVKQLKSGFYFLILTNKDEKQFVSKFIKK